MSDEVKKECECGGHEDGGSCGCGEHGCGCGHDHGGNGAEEFDFAAHDVPLPKPTLVSIVTVLAQQAMTSMGVLPNPMTGTSVFLFNQASHLIDSIQVINEKTKAAQTADETRVIENVLSELRMLYVSAMSEKARRDAEKAQS